MTIEQIKAADHHFNPDHPDYDPDCRCGSPRSTRQRLAAAIHTPGDESIPSLPTRGERDSGGVSSRALSFLTDLISQAESRLDEPSILSLARAALASEDREDVTEAIDLLKAALKTAPRANQFAGKCRKCGSEVAADSGLLKGAPGNWWTEHKADDCPSPQEAEKAVSEARASKYGPETGLDLTDLPSGRYADPSGESRLKLHVKRPGKNSRHHGRTFVQDAAAYGYGKAYGVQEPGETYRGDVTEVLERILANSFDAARAYGKLIGACGICGRHLEDELSVKVSIGPVCAKKFGVDRKRLAEIAAYENDPGS